MKSIKQTQSVQHKLHKTIKKIQETADDLLDEVNRYCQEVEKQKPEHICASINEKKGCFGIEDDVELHKACVNEAWQHQYINHKEIRNADNPGDDEGYFIVKLYESQKKYDSQSNSVPVQAPKSVPIKVETGKNQITKTLTSVPKGTPTGDDPEALRPDHEIHIILVDGVKYIQVDDHFLTPNELADAVAYFLESGDHLLHEKNK